jgi:3-isopropylmalate/(R)-2-methylmalate dehydratase small subunit
MSEQHVIAGIAAPLPINNLDTDQIMPKQFLLGIDKSGLARAAIGVEAQVIQHATRENFVLNRPEYQGVRVLLGGSNFGCGSSREHAVWGLQQTGIDAVIAPSYGEIFYFNALNNRLLLVTLPPEEVEALVAEVETASNKHIAIDVVGEVVVSPSGRRYAFSIPPRQ